MRQDLRVRILSVVTISKVVRALGVRLTATAA
jgi:hypothetical protein